MWGGGGVYDRWVSFLDEWSRGALLDPAGLPVLRQEDLPGDAWARLTNRVTDAIEQRLTGWAAALNRAIAEAHDEFELGRALSQARTGLRSVRAFVASGALPPELTGRLLEHVDQQIRSVQQSLEDTVDRMRVEGADRATVERRLRVIRDNPLIAVTREPLGGPAAPAWSQAPAVPSRRRVIVDPSQRG